MRQITKQNNQGNTSIYQKLHMNYKSMNAMANSFSISKEVADSLSATTSLLADMQAYLDKNYRQQNNEIW